jgi:hypothetical protein
MLPGPKDVETMIAIRAALLSAALALAACSAEKAPEPATDTPPPAADLQGPLPSPVAPDASPAQKPPSAPADAQLGSDDPNDYPDLKIEVLKTADKDAKEALYGTTAQVHYTGTLSNGREFDSSWRKGTQPVDFELPGSVVKGFALGLKGMKVGERRRITIPPRLGYGAAGNPSAGIPGDATLFFDLELAGVVGQ